MTTPNNLSSDQPICTSKDQLSLGTVHLRFPFSSCKLLFPHPFDILEPACNLYEYGPAVMHWDSMTSTSVIPHLVSEAQLSSKIQFNPVTLKPLELNSVVLCLQHFSKWVQWYLNTAGILFISMLSVSPSSEVHLNSLNPVSATSFV